MSSPIPQPPAYPLLGNITDVDPENGTASLMHLADKYGELFISASAADAVYRSPTQPSSVSCWML
jgi:hypothetical protein